MKNAKIFLTDCASYNDGTQFEFGHWVRLNEFDNVAQLMSYIKKHFQECDVSRPIPGKKREEIMISDHEGFPGCLYSESMNSDDFEKIYKLLDWMDSEGLETLDNVNDNLVDWWNDYSDENNMDDRIFTFDEEALTMLAGSNPIDIFQAGINSQINWDDAYIFLNGYGHIVSTDDPSYQIDETVLIDWIIETKI